MKRKILVCSPDCGCGLYQRILSIVHSHGIEPVLKKRRPEQLELSHAILFRTPANWTIKQLRELNENLWKDEMLCGMAHTESPCVVCFSRDYTEFVERSCRFCRGSIRICEECKSNFPIELNKIQRCSDCWTKDPIDEKYAHTLKYLMFKSISSKGDDFNTILKRINRNCSFEDADTQVKQVLHELVLDQFVKKIQNRYMKHQHQSCKKPQD